jgi:endonuclease/exonuclease/phosphatase family metal-dependent hydrolase
VQFTAIAWNLFHGRDSPPDPALLTWRSRLLGSSEQNATHVQVNRGLEREFASILSTAEWDVALLQEAPPRFIWPLAEACGADAHRVLTSRNQLGWLRGAAARLNPDLIASGEGGSNLTLVRPRTGSPVGPLAPYGEEAKPAGGLGEIVERREVVIHRGRPERRALALTRTACGLCVANLHATNANPSLAGADVLAAAGAASEWAGERPLLFGGDLNLRPAENPEDFELLGQRYGLLAPTDPDSVDHLLVRGLRTVRSAAPWPAERRELREESGLALRLSDHAPLEARFATITSGN